MSIVLIFVTLGAVATIAIAFACALWSQPREFDPQFMARVRREFFQRDGGRSGRAYWPLMAYKGFGAQFMHIAIDEPDLIEDPVSGSYPSLGVLRAGWPWTALEAECWHDATRAPRSRPAEFRWTVPIANRHVRADRLFIPRMLPLRPMWPGLALNVALYALLLWLIWFSARLTRQAVRIRRQLCPWCAYPIGLSARCSECGRELDRWHAKLSP